MVLSVFQTTWAQESKNTQSGQLSETSISEQDVASNGYDKEATRNCNKIADCRIHFDNAYFARGWWLFTDTKEEKTNSETDK